MKTIQVSDETYEFLKLCQEELNTQNNRGTANPIFGFQVAEKVASYDPHEYEFVSDDHTSVITTTERENWQEELAEYILAQYDESVDDQFNFLNETFTEVAWPVKEHFTDDEIYAEELKKDLATYIKNLNYYEYENFCDEVVDIKVYGYVKEWKVYDNSFSFFESDTQAHLDMNKHNMREYQTYVYSTFRTPKMGKLLFILRDEMKII